MRWRETYGIGIAIGLYAILEWSAGAEPVRHRATGDSR